MVSPWSLSDSKSPQISRTLLSILADLNKVLVWMASSRPLISKYSNPCINLLVTVPRAPITIGITVIYNHYYPLFPIITIEILLQVNPNCSGIFPTSRPVRINMKSFYRGLGHARVEIHAWPTKNA